MSKYAKAIAAGTGAALMVLDGVFVAGPWHIVILCLLAAGTAAGVWAVPNATAKP